jgi:hypothetical protein
MGAARPVQVAELVTHRSALRDVVSSRSCHQSPAAQAALINWGRSFNSTVEELKQNGMRFVAAIQEELAQGVCGRPIIDLLDEINSAIMEVIVSIVAAVLRLPAQIEAVSATVAAIFCKSGGTRVFARV